MPGVARERIWTASQLDPGLLNLGDLDHMRRLLDKLNSGKRIVAVALGSSLVHDYAGCWHSSPQAVWQLGVIPNPFLYPPQGHAYVDLNKFKRIRDR